MPNTKPLRDVPGKKTSTAKPGRRVSGNINLPDRIAYNAGGVDKILDLTSYDTWTAEEVTTYVETIGVPIGNAFCQHKISGDILYRLNSVWLTCSVVSWSLCCHLLWLLHHDMASL